MLLVREPLDLLDELLVLVHRAKSRRPRAQRRRPPGRPRLPRGRGRAPG
jgi:hypothetical protein